jgi:hypothetical protein
MRFDDADHDIDALGPSAMCRAQHCICLADAWRRAKKNLEAAAPFRARRLEQCFR